MADIRPAAESASDADLSGRQLSGYRLLRRLGKGAMAEVYLAEQVSLGRQVALKVLRTSLASDATYVERFQQEARAAAQLVHANIVQIYEVGFADGVHFIAQEYVQGMNLAELLVRRGSPELARMVSIVRQVAAALNKAAEHGIVHRDIKPENIMLSSAGEVKVADFGLARLASREDPTSLTQVGITMGTPLYMSPEQIEGRPLDTRSDIYSLGIMSYEMLTGEPPFRGETALTIAVQHLQNPPQRLENVRADLPAALCRIVHTMLAKEPKDRYVTPRQLLSELRVLSIELFQDDPGEEDGWHDDLLSTVEARRQATQRLAVAMRTTAMPSVRRSGWARWVALTAACFVLGAGGAWALRPRPLIAPVAEDPNAIARHNSADTQLIYATMLDSEAGWKSVSYYFPSDKKAARQAMQGLALLYLRDHDYARALAIFNDFAAYNDAEVQFKAFGLAGQAVVFTRQNRLPEAAKKLTELWPLHDKLEGEMRTLVEAMSRDRQFPGDGRSLQFWRDWSRSLPPNSKANSDGPSGKAPGGG